MMILYQILVTVAIMGFYRLLCQNLKEYAPAPAAMSTGAPLVSVLVPARNESSNIEPCLERICQQSYPYLEILALDDGSEDDTALRVEGLARRDARIQLLRGDPLPAGWAGKAWACQQLGMAASGDWLLFLDADTRAGRDLAAHAVAFAQSTGASMVSTIPCQWTGSFWERVMAPMIHFMLLVFLPVRKIGASSWPAYAAACGQVELFNAGEYRRIGGHAAVKGSFHDGLQLARRVKQEGGSLRLFDGTELISCRMYDGGRAAWQGFTRNAYEGIGSPAALMTLSTIQLLLFLAPLLFLGVGLTTGASWTTFCALQVVLIIRMRWLLAARFHHRESTWLHPVSILALLAIEWASFVQYRRGSGGTWKGRKVERDLLIQRGK